MIHARHEGIECSAISRRRSGVVVADDDENVLDALVMALTTFGFEVQAAADGIAAFELAARHRPAVMILDLEMPRLDGYGAARRIRAQSWGEIIKLIAHSGCGEHEDVLAARAAGFDAHLTKAGDPRALLQLVTDMSAAARD